MTYRAKHEPCQCGCGELADECMAGGHPLAPFTIAEPVGYRFWIDLDAEDEPTLWTGDRERPTAVLRRCEISGDEATRDAVMRRAAR